MKSVPTGSDGLDSILAGGYAPNRVHLIEGSPGTGKTTLALQFLLAGVRNGERGLYITLSETRDELLQVAGTHGWTLDGIEIFELIPPELSLDPNQAQSVLYASDLELGETVRMVLDEVARTRPTRIVFDSLSEIRLLAQGAMRYRRQVLALKHFFAQHGATVLFLDDLTSSENDVDLHSLVHGVIRLEQLAIDYGAERRRIRVFKMRARRFRGGYHDYVIRRGGLDIFPRLIAAEHHRDYSDGTIESGVGELDAILGGGLDRGTSTLILGPSGAGKSTVALQYLYAAMERGEKTLIVAFDETQRIFLRRTKGLGFDTDKFHRNGMLRIAQVDPAELSPGELSGMVRDAVDKDGVRAVLLDSLSGYQHAMLNEQHLLLQMHELLTYLNQQGVVTIMVLAQHGLVGPMQTSVDLTYVSDTVLLLRYFEAGGRIRRALSVLKKRTGAHEATIRELNISSQGIRVGAPLDEFQGVLTGVPEFLGENAQLLKTGFDDR
ncbi:ATPase domain-containing protein [Roseiterribacter gracilis]